MQSQWLFQKKKKKGTSNLNFYFKIKIDLTRYSVEDTQEPGVGEQNNLVKPKFVKWFSPSLYFDIFQTHGKLRESIEVYSSVVTCHHFAKVALAL